MWTLQGGWPGAWEGGFSLSLGSLPSPWGLRAPVVPLCLSQHPLPASVSCCREHQEHPGWLLLNPRERGMFQVLEHSSWQGTAPQDASPSSPHRAVQNEPRQPWWHQDVYSPCPGEGHTWGPCWGSASVGMGSRRQCMGRGGTGTRDRDSGALPWAGTWAQWLTHSPSWHSPSGCRFSLPCTSWGRGPAGTGIPSSTGRPHRRAAGHWRPSRCRGQPPALS